MIAGLRGYIYEKSTDRIIVDVSGVRYLCHVSLTTASAASEVGGEVDLHVHTHVREDALQLFGFATEPEKRAFLALISVSGIGPKVALTMLSGMSADDLAQAIVNEDIPRLVSVPGVGKKTAERMLVELREPMAKLFSLVPGEAKPASGFAVEDELISALLNLGYKQVKVRRVVEKLAKTHSPETPVEELIRAALIEMQS